MAIVYQPQAMSRLLKSIYKTSLEARRMWYTYKSTLKLTSVRPHFIIKR